MKTFGVIIIGIGIILTLIKVVPTGIAWIIIFIGVIFLLLGYLLRTKAS